MARKVKRSTLIKKLDKLAGQIIRKRDKQTCQKCGKKVTGSDCHVSHVIPKSKGYALRWHLDNLKILCMHCHLHWWHKNPLEASTWYDTEFPYRADYLREHKNDLIQSKNRDDFISNKFKELEEEWKNISG